MRHIRSTHYKLSGELEIFTLDSQGRETVLVRAGNEIQFEGFDALAAIMAGEVSSSINVMYFKFLSGGGAASESPAGRSNPSSVFRGLASPWDFVRAQMSPGARAPQNSNYVGNQITFTGVAETGAIGEISDLVMNDSSEITMVALVVAPSWADRTQDLVYAAYAPAVPISPPTGSAVGLRWRIRFAAEA